MNHHADNALPFHTEDGTSSQAGHGAEEVLAMVCHELRSPVAAVRHAARLWSSQVPQAPGQQALQAVIERQTERMTRLIDDLLRIAGGA